MRTLHIREIDFRIQSINKGGYATILAYKDARVDMKILDEVYGAGYWQRKHEIIDGVLFCSVGIYNEDIKEWVWVQDCGTESMAEKEKGRASDAFKRACFNLGIGRELYDYPLIQVKLNPDEFKEHNGRMQQTYNLKLRQWHWYKEVDDKGNIVYLAAKDTKGNARFAYGKFTDKDKVEY